eukprot:6060031-Prymnesium_polylepis.2
MALSAFLEAEANGGGRQAVLKPRCKFAGPSTAAIHADWVRKTINGACCDLIGTKLPLAMSRCSATAASCLSCCTESTEFQC